MSLQFTLDTRTVERELSKAFDVIASVSDADFKTFLKRSSQLGLAAGIRFTPPYKKARLKGRVARTKTSSDRRAGVQAITRDVKRTHLALDGRNVIKSPSLRKAFNRAGTREEKRRVLEGARWRNVVLRDSFDVGLHDRNRDKRGRVRRRPVAVALTNLGAVESGIHRKTERVGFTCSGWKKGARALKIPLPGWIMDKNAPGTYTEVLQGATKFILIRNQVTWLNDPQIIRAGNSEAALAMERLSRFMLRAWERTGNLQQFRTAF